MPFEFDRTKSAANKAKHGIDFEEAQALWEDDNHIIIPSRYPAEERYAAIGLIAGKLWSAIVTIRGGNARIISVRRARHNETETYLSRRA